MSEYTEWFDGNKFVPGHVGWWHTGYGSQNPNYGGEEAQWNSWWDGELWMASKSGPILFTQNRTFRGLKKPCTEDTLKTS